jgi:hypothetical protein
MALTPDRAEEGSLKARLFEEGIRSAGVDYGGEFTASIRWIVERAVVAAKREGIIGEQHAEEGAVAGASHEATEQLLPKAVGLNIAVALYFGISLLHLDDVAIVVAHRAVPEPDHMHWESGGDRGGKEVASDSGSYQRRQR